VNAVVKRVLSGLGAVLVASCAATVAAHAIMLLTGGRMPQPSDVAEMLRSFGPVIFTIALAHALLLGLPFVWLLHRFRADSVWTMAAGGFAIGALPISLFVQMSPILVLCGASGAVGAVAYHWMNRYVGRRPVPV
jgi:hypothetical protein